MTKSRIKFGALLAVMLIMSMALVPAVSAKKDMDIVEKNYVSIEKAREHAANTLLEFIAAGSPGLKNTDWINATINPDPLIIHDINGKKLFYEFSIEKEGKSIGSIKTSASKVLGSLIMTIGLKPLVLDSDAALQIVKKNAKENYKGSEIISTTLVSYSYPKIGIMVQLRDLKTNKEQRMFVDAYDHSIIPDRMPKDNEQGVWSLYDNIPNGEKVKRISTWDENDKKSREIINGSKPLVIAQSNPNILSDVSLFAQENGYYCAPAVGQMIADYYGETHSQTYIAGIMGTNPTSYTDMDGMLKYYKQTLGKSNSQAYDVVWEDMKDMIDAGLPFVSAIPGHVRTGAGWGTFYAQSNYIYVLDPYPANQGNVYWEPIDCYQYLFNIYVQ